MTRHVYIVEDHTIVRDAVAAYVSMIPGTHVCGGSDSGETALGMLGTVKPDIVIVDLSLPGMTGIELIATIHARWPKLKTLVLSAHREPHYVRRALSAGASGYILKGRPSDLRAALDAVERGEEYLSPDLYSNADAFC